jgi:hypothetical protein
LLAALLLAQLFYGVSDREAERRFASSLIVYFCLFWR